MVIRFSEFLVKEYSFDCILALIKKSTAFDFGRGGRFQTPVFNLKTLLVNSMSKFFLMIYFHNSVTYTNVMKTFFAVLINKKILITTTKIYI